jgi:uncharacterized membrane protein
LSLRFLVGQLIYLTLVVFGLVLLVAPGIWLAARLALFGFQIASRNYGVVQSFGKSVELTRGASGQLAVTVVALVAFNLLGAALLGLGLVVTVPLSVLTMATIFRQLSASTSGVDR